MTGKQMCETISFWLLYGEGVEMRPEDIWNSSPTGELWHVSAMFERALQWLGLEPYFDGLISQERTA